MMIPQTRVSDPRDDPQGLSDARRPPRARPPPPPPLTSPFLPAGRSPRTPGPPDAACGAQDPPGPGRGRPRHRACEGQTAPTDWGGGWGRGK
ncbi:basic proline-rich protein-like [Rhea pennata]|uniref:basic proline-rich protein-like n=1 Tax=Rhea pennata TaxID=8795 RepID=UPI002E256E4D